MSEMLQEFVDSGSHWLRVDRASGVIRGVKLLGLQSRNGRRYEERALAEAAGLYEGAKVNVNHPKGHPLAPRDYQDRLGVICGVQFRPGEGLFGDLQFNPKHALSEQLVWDAEHAPQNVGLSHNVLARTSRQGDETVVEAITKVQSIDLVADPAATRGLFEQEERASTDSNKDRTGPTTWDALTLEAIELHRPDLLEEYRHGQAIELDEVRSGLEQIAIREAAIKRRERIAELLREHDLPLPTSKHEAARKIVGEHFVETLMNAPDDRALCQLVEERSALIRSAKNWNAEPARIHARPVSREQAAAVAGVNDRGLSAAEFAASIRGR